MSKTMSTAQAGRLGGIKSRRTLSPQQARAMVCVREARRLFRAHHLTAFWWVRPDLPIALRDVPWVADQLRKHGGRDAWSQAARLDRLHRAAS